MKLHRQLGLLLLSLCPLALALDNGLALTPPMGWLSWERFACVVDCEEDPDNCISAALYMRMADELVAGGYQGVCVVDSAPPLAPRHTRHTPLSLP